MQPRTFVIGDVHGCLSELEELLDRLSPSHGDGLVFLGDLVDRGPNPVETVRYVRKLASRLPVAVVKGNHEQKLCLWRKRESQRLEYGRENKMRPPPPERRAQWEAFTEDDVRWMEDLPVFLDLEDNWMAVHAGLLPGVPRAKQDPDKVTRIRTVHPDTMKVAQLTDESGPLEDPPGTVFWSSLWRGPWSVVYGHAVKKGPWHDEPLCLELPRVDRTWTPDGRMVTCLGIDTGCVFGGRLTAAVLHPNGDSETVQVQARAPYAELGRTR